MKKLAFTTLMIGLLAITTFAQRDETIFGKSGLRLTGAWGANTTNLTLFEDDFAVITGGYGGLEFGKSIFIGWGGYGTSNDFRIGTDLQNTDLNLRYNGLMLGYAPLAHRAIHPKFTILAGSGNLRIRGEGTDNVLVVEPGILDGGYRFVTNTDLLVNDSDVSAAYGQLTFKFGYSWGSRRSRSSSKYNDIP